jgi:undecaprenyl-diphosphatase
VTEVVARVRESLVELLRWLVRRVHGLYTALGLVLILSLGSALAAVWAFSELAEQVVRGSTARFDNAVLEGIHRYASPWWDGVALAVTSVGNGMAVAVISLVACAFLWVFRRPKGVLLVAIAVIGADLGQGILKAVFQRPRPELFVIETPFARPMSASFPSGHATGAIALYLVLGYLLAKAGGGRLFRWLVHTIAALLVLAIGLSRVYLGVHYPSDVIAGYLIGFVWVTVCVVGLQAVSVIRARSRQGRTPGPAPTDHGSPADPGP